VKEANPYLSERIRRIMEGMFASGGPYTDEIIGDHQCEF
jgi:hypothetical protein